MCLKKPMQTNSPCLEYCLLDFLVRKLHSIELKFLKLYLLTQNLLWGKTSQTCQYLKVIIYLLGHGVMKSKGLIHHLMSIFTKLSSWELSQVGGASYKQVHIINNGYSQDFMKKLWSVWILESRFFLFKSLGSGTSCGWSSLPIVPRRWDSGAQSNSPLINRKTTKEGKGCC